MSERTFDLQMGETFVSWQRCSWCDANQLHEFPVDRRVGFKRCTGCFTHTDPMPAHEPFGGSR